MVPNSLKMLCPNPLKVLFPKLPENPKPVTLPQELVDEIISHVYDTGTLLSCSMVCRSWCIATRPYLHYSLETFTTQYFEEKLLPDALHALHALDLLQFVKRLCINTGVMDIKNFTCRQLDSGYILPRFSALDHLRELQIDRLELSSFMPDIKQYFGHLAPTLKSLSLAHPIASRREILYFIGLFPSLQDFILWFPHDLNAETAASSAFVPLSRPPLRGRLSLAHFGGREFVKDMITFHGGLRFRRIELISMGCVHQVLETCVETLEILRLHSTEQANEILAHRPINMSRHESLRELELTVESIVNPSAPGFLQKILSTISPSLSLKLVIIYDFFSIYPKCSGRPNHAGCSKRMRDAERDRRQSQRFEVLHRAREVRDFQLVLCAEVRQSMVECAMRVLEHDVKIQKDRGFDSLLSGSSIVSVIPQLT